jgi:Skp family chaperone for outer membrane proteins
MNTSIKTILAVAAMSATAIVSQAAGQPAQPKVLSVDLGKALNGYYRTAEESAKLQAYEQGANKTAEGIVAEGKAMADKFKAAQDAFNSPATTDLAKKQAQDDAQRIYGDIQKKEAELNDYRQKAVQQIQQTVMETRQRLLVEIANKATDIGKSKGATLIVERNSFVYADPGMDITDEVLAALNKGQPAPSAQSTARPGAPAPVAQPGRK